MGRKGPKPRPDQDRFWEKVNKDGPVPLGSPELGPCWVWTGGVNKRRGGYGIFYRGRTPYRAHRVSLEWELGRHLPPEVLACHKCDNPACVRPSHMYEGDRQTNVQDMMDRHRYSRGDTHYLSKLIDDDVLQIRIRAASGEQKKDIARDYPVCIPTIVEITRGKTWRHVGGPITKREDRNS